MPDATLDTPEVRLLKALRAFGNPERAQQEKRYQRSCWGLCQSNGRSSTYGAARPDPIGHQAARARHSANAPARLCL